MYEFSITQKNTKTGKLWDNYLGLLPLIEVKRILNTYKTKRGYIIEEVTIKKVETEIYTLFDD